jgi:hypothetical protein
VTARLRHSKPGSLSDDLRLDADSDWVFGKVHERRWLWNPHSGCAGDLTMGTTAVQPTQLSPRQTFHKGKYCTPREAIITNEAVAIKSIWCSSLCGYDNGRCWFDSQALHFFKNICQPPLGPVKVVRVRLKVRLRLGLGGYLCPRAVARS